MKKHANLPELENFQAYHQTTATKRAAEQCCAESSDGLTRNQRIVSWVCCLIAAGIMMETLFFKFSGAAESKFIFHKMGTERWWRWGQGIWELAASVCLLLPGIRWFGGILTAGAMAAAIISHLTWLGFSIQGDHGLLFGMAVTTFMCGFTVLILHRHSIPFVTPLSSW